MHKTLERPDGEAYLNFEESSAQLEDFCGCDDSCPKDPDSYSLRTPRYCLLLLAHTAIQLVRQISTIASIPPDLRPRNRGLELLHHLVLNKLGKPPQDGGVGEPREESVNLLNALDGIDLLKLASIVFGFEHYIDDES